MHTLDRVLMSIGASIVVVIAIVCAYQIGEANGAGSAFTPSRYLFAGLLVGVVCYGVGFLVEQTSKSIRPDS
ncbi:MAG: hypothetical protein AAGL49_04830 [Pseudomonadota bacterium]